MTETIATKRREAQVEARKRIKESLEKGIEAKEESPDREIESTKVEAVSSTTGEILQNPTENDNLTVILDPIPQSDQSTLAPIKIVEESKTVVIVTDKIVSPILEAAPEQPQVVPPSEEEKKEQQRTKDKKVLFITFYKKTLGSVKSTCDQAGIDRTTFYEWMKIDPKFLEAIKQAFREKLEDVEELANKKMLQLDGAMIKHFLDRRHPLYKPKIKYEGPTPGELSGEDDVDEFFGLGDNEKDGNDTNKNKPRLHRTEILDQEQARPTGEVQTKPGPEVLLVKKDEKKPDTQGAPEGDK